MPEVEQPDVPKALREWVTGSTFEHQLSEVLPRHLEAGKFAAMCLTAFQRNRDLYRCTRGSLSSRILELASLGLPPDGQRAWLTAWENDQGTFICERILGYKGYLELLWRTGVVSSVHADWVGAKEQEAQRFSFAFGQNQHLRHEPLLGDERGEPVAFYCYITFKDRDPKFEVMSLKEIEQTRNLSWGYIQSKRSRSQRQHPWDTHFPEMGKKTVFIRCTKWMELSPELRLALDGETDALPEAAVKERQRREQGTTGREPTPNHRLGMFADAQTSSPDATPETPPPSTTTPTNPPAKKPDANGTAPPAPPASTQKAAPPAPPPEDKPFTVPPVRAPGAVATLAAELQRRMVPLTIHEPKFVAWLIASQLTTPEVKSIDQIDEHDLRMIVGSWQQVVDAFCRDTSHVIGAPPPEPPSKPVKKPSKPRKRAAKK